MRQSRALFLAVVAMLTALAASGPAEPYKGKVFLGINTITVRLPKDDRYASTHGVRVTQVSAASAAEKAGLRVGDIVVSIDGIAWTSEQIRLSYSFGKIGAKAAPGDRAVFQVLRSDPAKPDAPGRLEDIPVVLTPYPDTAPELPATPDNDTLRPDLKNFRPAYQDLCEALVRACGYEEETRDLLERLARSEEYPDPHRLPLVRYVHRDAFKIEAVSREIVKPLMGPEVSGAKDIPRFIETAENALLRFDAASREKAREAEASADQFPAFAGKDLKAHLDYVEAVLKVAAGYHARAFAALTPEEILFIQQHRTGLLDAFIHHHMLSYDRIPERQRACIQVLRLAKKVDVASLFRQARVAALLVTPEFTSSLREAAGASGTPLDKAVIAQRKTPYGTILVAGTGRSRYEGSAHGGNYAAIYELGGDDVYSNNCASSMFGSIPTAIIVDYGGDDSYESTEAFRQTYGGEGVALTAPEEAEGKEPPARFTQGAGDLGVGILVDLKGNDSYIGIRYSQGVGFMGIGILCDEAGDDVYRGMEFHQGVAHWGAGILIDGAGRDRYEGHESCQAVGFTGGIGILFDGGAGDDSYYCKGKTPTGYGTAGVFEGWGQGLGVGYRPYASGGIGLLVDRGGSDRFEAGNFSQGGGYYYGFGLLYNAGQEADTYIGSRYAQGFACHQAAGALIEEGGDDRYLTRYAVAQGLSWDESSALFLDESGDDRYEGGGFSQGASAQNGFVLFIDRAGRDTYVHTDQARAGGNDYHGGKSLSFFVDIGGGEDAYPSKPNNAIVPGGANSLFADLPGSVEDALKGEAWKGLLRPQAKGK